MKPEVSVIIPAYNCEDYIAQALESVFAQTFNDFEVIVIDDASKVGTLEIVRGFQAPRLQIIAHQDNQMVSNARNTGIRKARGNWIAVLDSDDWYASERLEHPLSVAIE